MKKLILPVLFVVAMAGQAFAQSDMQYWRPYDKRGVNVFETTKEDTLGYDGFKVRVGGDFAMQFQSIRHSNNADNLVGMGSDFNLPSANLNLDVQLHDGVRMHLRTYLSSRHHNEAWIKGGHIQFDKLDFIKPGFLGGLMEIATIRIGLDEFNYGDAHFRRSDNAAALYNPFVEGYIMDAFSTEAYGEVILQKNGFLAVLGLTNGKLNQNVVTQQATTGPAPGFAPLTPADNKPSFYGKIGYDNQITDDLRVRLTGSWYRNHGLNTGANLYGGDRAGSRYYNVMRTIADPQTNTPNTFTNFDGRYNARYTQLTAIQVNPFVKFQGFEFFGVYEKAMGNAELNAGANKEGDFTQIAGEVLFRFGANENFYVGGRYNTVKGKATENDAEQREITRVNFGGGWFMTKNIMAKFDYVNQQWKNDAAWTGNLNRFAGGQFKGFVIEAVIGF
jgi:hypothetical protein